MGSTVDIILLVYDQVEYTRSCIESVLANTDMPYRLVVLDNGSVEAATVNYLAGLAKNNPQVEILRNDINQGFVAAVNKGLAYSRSEYICILSNDTIVYPGWLSQMAEVAQSDDSIGLVNPLWEIPKYYKKSRDDFYREVICRQKGMAIETDWARGFCYLVNRKLYNAIGGLDMAFAPAYYDDWDYSVRAQRAGFRCMYAKGAFVWHHKCVTYERILGKESLNKALELKAKLFYSRWGRPVSILFVLEPGITGQIKKLEFFFLKLLRDQNKLVIMTPSSDPILRHTNCAVKSVSGLLFNWRVLIRILKNRAHHRVKRYYFIVASNRSYAFLNKFPFIRKEYILRRLPHDHASFEELISYVDKLKQSQTERDN